MKGGIYRPAPPNTRKKAAGASNFAGYRPDAAPNTRTGPLNVLFAEWTQLETRLVRSI